MKKLYIMVLLALVAATIFALETAEKTAADAKTFLSREEEKSAANHHFLDENVFGSHENRVKLNEYRSKFNAIDARIYVLKNQISVALKASDPDMQAISTKRQQLQAHVDEHDKLLAEYKQWVSTLKQKHGVG